MNKKCDHSGDRTPNLPVQITVSYQVATLEWWKKGEEKRLYIFTFFYGVHSPVTVLDTYLLQPTSQSLYFSVCLALA